MPQFFLQVLIFFSLVTGCYAQANLPSELSLREAILLAARQNPNVQQAQLNHVLQKFALEVQHWQFQPHFSVQATATTTRNYSVTPGGYVTKNATGITPTMTLLTPMGTNISVAATNNMTDHYNPGLSLQIEQPLLRGFGRPIVEAALYNAIDSEHISRLSMEGTLRDTVTAVIYAYLDVLSAKNILEIDRKALKRAQISEQQTQLFIKAGHKAGVELVTVQAEVADANKRIEDDKNNLDQARYALLTTIGMDPNSNVIISNIDVVQLIKRYHVPSLEQAKQLSLANDIQYQVDQITLHGATQRNVQAAQDDTRWQLNLTLNSSTGNGTGGGPNAGLNSLVNGVNQNNSAALNLTIPIDDHAAKTSLASAKIALQQAEIALRQEKWNKETNAITGWNSIFSAERSLSFAVSAEQLQNKTYQVSFQKYSYGLIDGLTLQSAQQRLSDAQQNLLDARVRYLKSLVTLDALMGSTLKTWDIQVREG